MIFQYIVMGLPSAEASIHLQVLDHAKNNFHNQVARIFYYMYITHTHTHTKSMIGEHHIKIVRASPIFTCIHRFSFFYVNFYIIYKQLY